MIKCTKEKYTSFSEINLAFHARKIYTQYIDCKCNNDTWNVENLFFNVSCLEIGTSWKLAFAAVGDTSDF